MGSASFVDANTVKVSGSEGETALKADDVVIVDLKGKLTLGLGDQILRDTVDELLAEKVETQGEFQAARATGFQLFQGYFFCEPETITRKALRRMLDKAVRDHADLMKEIFPARDLALLRQFGLI